MEPSVESMRFLRLLSGGMRILQLRPNGEMDRVVRQSGLVPRKPFELTNITIMPQPSYHYRSTLFDISVPASSIRHQILSLDLDRGITKVEAFAVHPTGTTPLTPELLQSDEHLFTVYYFCQLRQGRQVIIRARPDFMDIEEDLLLAQAPSEFSPT